MSTRLERALLREDFVTFYRRSFLTLNPATPYLENWYVRYIAYQLVGLFDRGKARAILNVPPRYGKSQLISAFTAWLMGKNPALRVIVVSYARDLSVQHAHEFRAIVASDWYRELFPDFEIKRATDQRVTTTLNGYRVASSIQGSITGVGADLIILDDPLKAQDTYSKAIRENVNQTYDNAIYSRLDKKKDGQILLVAHRLHERDLCGHVLAKGDWDQIVIPAIETEDRWYRYGSEPYQEYLRLAGEPLHAEREGLLELEDAKQNSGPTAFEAQYQQAPVPETGNVIKVGWLRYCEELPNEFDLVFVSWDTASTMDGNYSVGTVWGLRGRTAFVMDMDRGRWEGPELRGRIEALTRRHGADVTLIENTELGRVLTQEMRRSSEIRPQLWTPTGEKYVRIAVQAYKFEIGEVVLLRQAPWLQTYIGELLAFPNGEYDDIVDSTSQALNYISRRTAVRRPMRRRNPLRRDVERR